MYICISVLSSCTHIRAHVCRDLVHLDSSGPPGASSRPFGLHWVPHVHERKYTPCGACLQICNLWLISKSICIALITAHVLMLKTPVQYMPHSTHKCTCICASTPIRQCSNFFAMQIIVTHVATWAMPKKPSESTVAHGVVAATLSHRHHLIICIAADPIHLVYGLHSPLTANFVLYKILFPPFCRSFFRTLYSLKAIYLAPSRSRRVCQSRVRPRFHLQTRISAAHTPQLVVLRLEF